MWEYLIDELPGERNAQQTALNARGGDGWQLVAVEFHGSVRAYFKRRKQVSEPIPAQPHPGEQT